MDEKKLTDFGMIEKALKCLAGQKPCDLCVYDDLAMQDGEKTCINLVAEDTLDLIHRLQGDKIQLKWNYVELKERYVKVLDLNEKVIAKQKAEIERLTEEKNEIWDERNRICKGYWETMDECKPYRERNAELQKQVEELLNRRIEPKIFQCHADALEKCPKVEQAVKDTAKEALEAFICKLVNSRLVSTKEDLYVEMLETKDDLLKECYGVEVE